MRRDAAAVGRRAHNRHLNAARQVSIARAPQPTVVEPKLTAEQLKLKSGAMNMAQLEPQVAAPKLPVAPQRSSGADDAGAKAAADKAAADKAAAAAAAAKNVPPSPNVQNLQGARPGPDHRAGTESRPTFMARSACRPAIAAASSTRRPAAKLTRRARRTSSAPAAADQRRRQGKGNGVPAGIVVGAAPPGAATSAVGGTPNGTVGKGRRRQPIRCNLDAQKRMHRRGDEARAAELS